MSELSPRYNSKEVEATWYPIWESKGYFRPKSDNSSASINGKYVIVIPPPNVTGILHMGHALNNSIQDILVRWHRMKGDDTLWVPGVDHAGIATQNVVEKKLAKGKKTRQDLGREKFLEEVWKWKEEHGSTITRQLRRLGASCDWSRERFTMDEGLSKAVREAFVTLYDRGLIYRGNYIINWCPRCQTALSDEEAAHKDIQGGLYHIKYPIVPSPHPSPASGRGSKTDFPSPSGRGQGEGIGIDHVVVATTRPETMLGDTAVAIHPEDERYKHLIGKKVILPLMNREIPIIADEFVDPEFGTGFVKVTPAHDPNDFEMGRRHNLPQINVMNPDATINEHGGPYKGMDRFQARKKVIADLEEQGFFVRRDTHAHAVGHCYRCDTVVEPYLSKQWFVKMKPLAEKALAAHRAGKTKFYPDRWTKVYTNWMENIRDWCISRQIWWGHQIPVWYCQSCPHPNPLPQAGEGNTLNESPLPQGEGRVRGVIVVRETPKKCPDCGGTNLKQDPDVLDTWFSSWLWPFSTLGWPDKNSKDLKTFYPTSDLITAPEIIFFWVARMIMAGLEFMGKVPIKKIYLNGTVRAQSGMKMSKSLGNAIDPIEVIDEMGADALRFSMIMLSAQDVYLSREKFEVGRNFSNKIWNAARFTLMNLCDKKYSVNAEFDTQKLSLVNRWILSRLARASAEIEKYLSIFGMAQAATELYHFVWNDFCDWYLELSKPAITGTDAKEKEKTQQVLFFAFEKILRLLHPFAPFISEEIWHKLKEIASDKQNWPVSISLAEWPDQKHFKFKDGNSFQDAQAEKSIKYLQDAVSGVRDLRVRLNIPPSQALKAVVAIRGESDAAKMFKTFDAEISKLGRLEELKVETGFKKSKSYLGNAFADFEVFIYIEGLVDPEKERDRIEKKMNETKTWIESIRKKLSNQDFVKNAPSDLVEKEKEKLADAEKILKSHHELLAIFR